VNSCRVESPVFGRFVLRDPLTTRTDSDIRDSGGSRLTRIVALVLGLAIIGSVVAVLLGAPIWPLLALASVPWLLVVRERRGALIAVGGVVLALTWVVLVVLILTAALHLPMLLTTILIVGAAGILGAARVLVLRTIRRPDRRGVSIVLPALLGPLVWFGLVLSTGFVSSVARISWVMSGDSPNNLLFARDITYHSGILVGATQNPVPLPAALLAVFVGPGRGAVGSARLLEHDLQAFSQLWTIVIALVCFLGGIVAASLARAASDRVLVCAIVAAAASVLPISWLVLVYPVEDGFFGSHVALVIIFASLLVYQGSRRNPRLSFGLLLMACTLLLATWSPLVAIPGCLAVVVLIQDWRVFRSTRGRGLGVLIACVAQLLIYGIVVVAPAFLNQKQFLSGGGASYVFPPPIVFTLIGCIVIAAFLARRATGVRPVFGAIALAVGSLGGLGALLINSGRTGNFWTYYPSKFAWTVIVVIAVMLIGAVPAVLVRYSSRRGMRLVASVIAIAIVTGVVVTVPRDPEHPSMLPANWILNPAGDATAEAIVSSADLDHPTLYWESQVPSEQYINFWLLEVASRSVSNVKLRTYAYGYREGSIKDLCAIVTLIGTGVTIKTANPALAGSVMNTCPSAGAIVTLRS
jgi:hypothetical protein